MKKFFAYSVMSLALVVGLLLYSCQGTKTVAKAPKDALEKSLLWKVSGPDIQDSYLFGTIHILPQKDFALSEATKQAFGEAANIVLELDMDDPSLQMEMMQYAMMPDGITLKDHLSTEEYAKLDAWLQKSANVKLEMVHGMQPLLLTSLIMKEYLGEAPASYELSLVQMAKEQEKEILGLETVKEQMSAITDYGVDNQVRDLKDMIAQPEKYRDAFNQLVAAYKANDPDGLYQFMQSQMPGNSMNVSLIE
ncbi:MAG: TraB/GumN family protein, partial [Bacteroidota bacterium]